MQRTTRETSIEVTVGLDGTGTTDIQTGVGFYDHLLTSLGHHALFDLRIRATGDLEVDEHHTVEDVALVLGEAISAALGDRAGITRFGDARVPMDDAIASVAVDLSGRPYAVLDLAFVGRAHRRALDAERARTSSNRSRAPSARISTRPLPAATTTTSPRRRSRRSPAALRAAVELDPRRTGIASTKGSLG